VTIKSNDHSGQETFQESEYFKEKSKERYKIGAKNSELKHRHRYDVATSSGLIGMELQGAMSVFTVNLKRIFKITGLEKTRPGKRFNKKAGILSKIMEGMSALSKKIRSNSEKPQIFSALTIDRLLFFALIYPFHQVPISMFGTGLNLYQLLLILLQQGDFLLIAPIFLGSCSFFFNSINILHRP
jgi:hypothetical protein